MAPPTKASFAELQEQLAAAIALCAHLQVTVDMLTAKVTTLEDRVAMAVNQGRMQRFG